MALQLQFSQYKNKQILFWTDNHSVIYFINKPKSHPSIHNLLWHIYLLCALGNIQIKALYIPSKLNVTADYLSRHITSTLTSHYTITRSLFQAIGAEHTHVCAFTTPDRRSAHYLYGPRTPHKTILTPLNSFFTHQHLLHHKHTWFNPPFPLVEHTLELLATTFAKHPRHTKATGIVPYLPTRRWYHKYIG